VQASGNNIENFQGNVYINKTSYQNSKGIYDFDDFTIASSFDSNNVRTVNSPDIVEGEIVGKYEFNQLENLVKNSLGSLYTNFKPSKVDSFFNSISLFIIKLSKYFIRHCHWC
jgi:hypothetical protein